MPFTRIIVQAGRPSHELHQIADLFHQVLVEEFDVPADDRFQVIEERPAGMLHYASHYQAGTRSERYTLFHITAGKPRSSEQKRCFYQRLQQLLHTQLALPPDDVMVIIQFTTPDDWSFSRGVMYQQEA